MVYLPTFTLQITQMISNVNKSTCWYGYGFPSNTKSKWSPQNASQNASPVRPGVFMAMHFNRYYCGAWLQNLVVQLFLQKIVWDMPTKSNQNPRKSEKSQKVGATWPTWSRRTVEGGPEMGGVHTVSTLKNCTLDDFLWVRLYILIEWV